MAAHRGENLPDGWLIDVDGNPSNDPRDLLEEPRGSMLPLGGPVAYKGYGMSLMIELLGGALSGQGCADGEWQMVSNGVFMMVVDIDQFAGRDSYFDDLEALIRHVKSSRRAPGFDQIQLPGEIEFANARVNRTKGIDIDPITWKKICNEAYQLGLDTIGWIDG